MNFNKKMEKIKGVKVFVGIDVGKDMHYMSLVNEDGKVKRTGIRIQNDKEGFEKMIGILNGAGKKEELALGLEPTGHYWKALGYYLKEKGYRIYLVNPYHVKLSKEMRDNSQRKTDKKDSELIAHLVREGKFLNSRLLDGNYEELRRLTTLRERIVQEMIRCQIRLTSILDEYLPEYEKCFSKITIKTSLVLLKKYGIKGLTDRANTEEVVKDIVYFSRHRIKDMHARWIADRLTKSIGIKEGLTGSEFELQLWIKQLEGYKVELKNVEEEIKKVLEETEETKYLLSIKGVGFITAAVVLG
ncbi:MAG: IS110 family transposase [archaeon]